MAIFTVTRVAEAEFETEDLVPVRFVPLIGEDGWGSRFRLTMRKSVPQ